MILPAKELLTPDHFGDSLEEIIFSKRFGQGFVDIKLFRSREVIDGADPSAA